RAGDVQVVRAELQDQVQCHRGGHVYRQGARAHADGFDDRLRQRRGGSRLLAAQPKSARGLRPTGGMTRLPTRQTELMRSDINRGLFARRVQERLGFERAIGTLYDRIIAQSGDPVLSERLRLFRREEQLHAEMLESLLRQLGRNPDDAPKLAPLEEDDGSLDRMLSALVDAEMRDM